LPVHWPATALEDLADEALVGNAAGAGARLDGGEKGLRQAHVDARGLLLALAAHRLELRESRGLPEEGFLIGPQP
jgi:hypothetical protein